jgi:hypothetical protein
MESRFLQACLRPFVPANLWFGRHILKWNRLESIDLIELGAPLADAVAAYGDPDETTPDEKVAGAMVHRFSAGPFHDAVIVEWKEKISRITYWSAFPDPNRDLKCLLLKYGQNIGWNEVETGYLCIREDGKVWLWCSVAPALTVETDEFINAKRDAALAAEEGTKLDPA